MNFLTSLVSYFLAAALLSFPFGAVISLFEPKGTRLLALGALMVFPIVAFTAYGVKLGCVIDGIGDGRECVGWSMLLIVVIIAIAPGWILGCLLGNSVPWPKRKDDQQ